MAPSADAPNATERINSDLVLTKQTSHHLDLWSKHTRGGFPAFPVAVESAKDHIITDVDGKTYIDFISQYAVMNFGYSHPKIAKAAAEQMCKMPLVGTAYISPLGSEAVEAAVKIARKWAYTKKQIPENEAWILTTDQCYHGLTLATMPLATVVAKNYGQHVPNVGPRAPTSGRLIQYGDIDALAETFEQDGHRIAAFLVEPVQGWAGTIFPPRGYMKAVQDLCKKHNILLICDEIQAGYGRTGKDLSYQHDEQIHPDMVTMGKAVTGGFYPMSVVMGKKHVMDVLAKSEVLSTFGASPVACAAALASLDVLEEEKMSERAQRLGELLAETFKELAPPHVIELRGGGLFWSLVIDESTPGVTARRVAGLATLRGVLVGNGFNRLRFSPPLTITEEDLVQAMKVIAQALKDVDTMGDFPGGDFIN
ncbi:pyridoxal phosphate-dependent transferase [Thelonectria olida]|uniref:Ornithine aminotransferase n=1 Tax=Thelonectria olida TaxID=1576542 RepID=A0A9P8VTE8_9HYPO|nr:pyridoxal phosphate-dependent transferase [Thelonectria olida]